MVQEKKFMLRACCAAVPLTVLVFAFGMVQVMGIEQSYASIRGVMATFAQFSLLGKLPAKEGSFVVNGRTYQSRFGTLDQSPQDALASYDQTMTLSSKRVMSSERGGTILQSDGQMINLVTVEENERTRQTRSMEFVTQDIVTERQRAVADDPVVTQLFSSLQQRNITPRKLHEGIQEYSATQTISDPDVAQFLHELYLRLDEIKREIDVPGQDLDDLDRYPGSVRVLDVSKRNGTVRMISYRNDASLSANLSFYRTEIRKQDWQSIEGFEQASDHSDNLKFFLLRKPDRICLLSLKKTEDREVLVNMLTVIGFVSGEQTGSFRG